MSARESESIKEDFSKNSSLILPPKNKVQESSDFSDYGDFLVLPKGEIGSSKGLLVTRPHPKKTAQETTQNQSEIKENPKIKTIEPVSKVAVDMRGEIAHNKDRGLLAKADRMAHGVVVKTPVWNPDEKKTDESNFEKSENENDNSKSLDTKDELEGLMSENSEKKTKIEEATPIEKNATVDELSFQELESVAAESDFAVSEDVPSESIFSEKNVGFFTEEAVKSPAEIKDSFKDERKKIAQEKKDAKESKKLRQKKIKDASLKHRIRRPIGVKLIAIVSVLMMMALGGVTVVVSYFMTKDVRINAEENNLAINSRTASSVESGIKGTISSVGMFLDMLVAADGDSVEIRKVESMFFERNRDVAAVFVSSLNRVFTSGTFLASHEMKRETVESYFSQETRAIERATGGSFEILNSSPFFSVSLMTLFYPLPSGESGAVGVICSSDALGESFAAGAINQSFFINDAAEVIVHGDLSLTMSGADESENPIVKDLLSGSAGSRQMTYKDVDGNEFIGAFRKLSLGGGAVITTVKTSVVLEGIRRTTIRNVFVTAAILSISVMVIYFFAKSLTGPLKVLTEIVNEINRGNFNTELFEDLQVKRQDEVGVLAKSTQNEREILNMVSRLTNQGVTRAIIRKEIDFEPHLKDITIFFSDIRGFTAISDGFKNRFGEASAANIIGFLNDYMSRMVTCIRRTGGIVDKFEGDAIMACWGVLRHDDLLWENLSDGSVTKAMRQAEHDHYVTEDALSAITCCVAMRYSLMKYNKDARAFTEQHKNEPLAQYKPHIQIGAGLNSGRATVGFMGSFEKMEFTSIGDAVNFASRTEASNKPCGTDILITEDTRTLLLDYIRCEENDFRIPEENLKNEIIIEQIPVEFEVKGKGKQHFYGVVNMPLFDIKEFFCADDPSFEVDYDCIKACGPHGPRTLTEMRRILGIAEPEFGKVDLNAEENKIQVAGA